MARMTSGQVGSGQFTYREQPPSQFQPPPKPQPLLSGTGVSPSTGGLSTMSFGTAIPGSPRRSRPSITAPPTRSERSIGANQYLIEKFNFLSANCPACYVRYGEANALSYGISPHCPVITMNDLISFDRGLSWPTSPCVCTVGCGSLMFDFPNRNCRYKNILIPVCMAAGHSPRPYGDRLTPSLPLCVYGLAYRGDQPQSSSET